MYKTTAAAATAMMVGPLLQASTTMAASDNTDCDCAEAIRYGVSSGILLVITIAASIYVCFMHNRNHRSNKVGDESGNDESGAQMCCGVTLDACLGGVENGLDV